MELVQLIYHSRPVAAESGKLRLDTFRSIHRTSVRRNTEDGVGGFLILAGSHFVQLLEGERAHVMTTFDRVKDDPRHSHVTIVDILPCRTRAFANWAMGAAHDDVTIREAMLMAGIEGEQPIAQLSARQIMSLLAALANQSRQRAA